MSSVVNEGIHVLEVQSSKVVVVCDNEFIY